MGFFEDLLSGLSGGFNIATGIQNLTQGTQPTTTTVVTPGQPLAPSPYEQQFQQLSLASAMAALQEGGYQIGRNPDGSLTLTKRPLSQEEALQQAVRNQVNTGLLGELGGYGGAMRTLQNPLGSILNTQAQLGAIQQQSGLNRQALIAAIQARKQGSMFGGGGGFL